MQITFGWVQAVLPDRLPQLQELDADGMERLTHEKLPVRVITWHALGSKMSVYEKRKKLGGSKNFVSLLFGF